MRQVGDLFTANGVLGLVAHAILIPTGASAQGVPSVPRQPPVTPQRGPWSRLLPVKIFLRGMLPQRRHKAWVRKMVINLCFENGDTL